MPTLPSNTEIVKGNTLPKIPSLLHRGKVFLSTSVTENQPLGCLEAMSVGLPVVGFRTSGMPEIVREGETGFLVPLDDTDGMVERLRQLLGDEKLRSEMGRKARDYVVNNFSYYHCIDVYLNYFKTYLEGAYD